MRERERDSYTSQYKHKAIGNSTCLSLLLVPAALHWLDDLIFSGGHKAGTHRKSATSNHDNNKTTTNINQIIIMICICASEIYNTLSLALRCQPLPIATRDDANVPES